MPHPLHYDVRPASLNAHRWAVTLTIARPQALQRVALPVWIPGSYLVREFARHVSGLTARQGRAVCPAQAVDKCTWQVQAAPGKPLVIRYEVYAFDDSVRAAWLDAARGFFNATALLLRVPELADGPHAITLHRPADPTAAHWRVATALMAQSVDADGFGSYLAASYDELADSPVEMGAFWQGEFSVRGVPHRFVVAGAPPSFDGQRLLRDTQKICETAARLWHGARGKPPQPHYLFMLNATPGGYGGLEHRCCTALICARRDLPRLGQSGASEGYATLLGLISHEYFHTWNVKRLRPAEFARYDYGQENYTRLLWFFEGFTSYYDDLLLLRAGLIDRAAYLKLLAKSLNQVWQTPGRHVQPVAEASFDAWVKYYRPEAHTPNATVSYYAKGALVALCFDLSLRREKRPATLDDAMRLLWRRCKAGPMTESDFAAALQELTGRSFAAELAAWVHGTQELPVAELLAAHGITATRQPPTPAQTLGLRASEKNGLVTLTHVLDGGAAQAAGMAPGDEWLGVETGDEETGDEETGASAHAGWRLAALDDLPLYLRPGRRALALISRQGRLLRLPLALPEKAEGAWKLEAAASAGGEGGKGGASQGWPWH